MNDVGELAKDQGRKDAETSCVPGRGVSIRRVLSRRDSWLGLPVSGVVAAMGGAGAEREQGYHQSYGTGETRWGYLILALL